MEEALPLDITVGLGGKSQLELGEIGVYGLTLWSQITGINFYNSKICQRIRTNNFCRKFLPVVQCNFNLGRIIHNMIIG